VSDSVFVLTEGDYDEYTVRCACRTREDADELAKKAGLEVEEIPVYGPDLQQVERLFVSGVLRDGTTEWAMAEDISRELWPWELSQFDAPVKWSWQRHLQPYPSGELTVFGIDPGLVRRTFAEQSERILNDRDGKIRLFSFQGSR